MLRGFSWCRFNSCTKSRPRRGFNGPNEPNWPRANCSSLDFRGHRLRGSAAIKGRRSDFRPCRAEPGKHHVRVTVVVLTEAESKQYFRRPLEREGIQAIWLKIENRNDYPCECRHASQIRTISSRLRSPTSIIGPGPTISTGRSTRFLKSRRLRGGLRQAQSIPAFFSSASAKGPST